MRGFGRWTCARSLRLPPAAPPSSQRGPCVPHGAASTTVRRANMAERGAALCANAEQTHPAPRPAILIICSSLCAPSHALLDDNARRLVDNNQVYEEARPRRLQQLIIVDLLVYDALSCACVPAQFFPVRCYEVGPDRTASIVSIANMIQEVAANHAQVMWGEGTWAPPKMVAQDMAFALSKLHIRIHAPAKWCVAAFCWPFPSKTKWAAHAGVQPCWCAAGSARQARWRPGATGSCVMLPQGSIWAAPPPPGWHSA